MVTYTSEYTERNEREREKERERERERDSCLLYTSDAADDMQCVDLGGRRIIKKKKKKKFFQAEDGIRDVERSRGLGDVYKRQERERERERARDIKRERERER